MTQAFLHSLNISTLSTWISLAGFGTVGVMVEPWQAPPQAPAPVEETQVVAPDILLGDGEAAGNGGSAAADAALPPEAGELEPLPAPPDLPALAEQAPLPELPEAPAPAERVVESPRTTAAAGHAVDVRPRASAARAKGSPGKGTGSASGASAGGNGGSGQGAGLSNTARLAAGRMPAPAYPAAARRGGQTGTVVVEFTVDSNGRVIAAHAKSPSRWPLLNEEAVRTVRRWKFPPGGVMKLQRPIVFQLR
jgi:protein TonB